MMLTRSLAAFSMALLLALSATAAGHAGLLIADLELDPDPPAAGAPVELTLALEDRNGQAVPDAVIEVSARPVDREPADSEPAESAQAEREGVEPAALREASTPGTYRTTLVLPEAGAWRLRFVDRTLPDESSEASVTVSVGAEADPSGAIAFLFPPSGQEPPGASTWLAWLVGLPLLAAAVVTVLVLRRPPRRAEDEGGADRSGDGRG